MGLNYLSLFSGIGGLDLGLDRAGMTCVGQVEKDEWCRRVLAKHWPEVPRHDDVSTTPGWWLGGARPAVHLVAGGPPCQGHSVAGKRRGTGDERWGWPWYRSVVEALEPPWALVENVPNLVRTGLVDILRDLAKLGFDAWWGRVPAAAVGAPHLRWRLFVIAAHPERVKLRDQPGWSRGTDWESPTLIGHDGASWALAPAGGAGLEGPRGLHDPTPHPGPVVADGGWWGAEPGVGRVANGVPGRVDRLRGLGNAVVPQVGEHVGRLILAAAA